MKRWVCGLLLAASSALACAQSAPAPLLPAQAFFARESISQAQLSPSGRHLGFVAAAGDARLALYVLDLQQPGAQPQLRAQFDDVDVQVFHWAGDERLLFSVLDREAASGWYQREGPGLFSVAREGEPSKVRELVQRRSLYAQTVRTGMRREQALDVRHVLLAVPEAAGEEVVIGRWGDASRGEGLVPQWLNTRSGATRSLSSDELPPLPEGAATRFWFNERGQAQAVLLAREPFKLALLRRLGDGWETLYEADRQALPFNLLQVDARGTFWLLKAQGPAGLQALLRYDADKKAPEAEPMLSLPQFDFSGRLIEQDGRLLGLRFEAERLQTLWFDETMKSLQAQADAQWPERANTLDCRRCGQADATVLMRSHSDRDPGQYWLFEAAGNEGKGAWRALARVLPGIDPQRMAGTRLVRVVARDGLPLPVWITEPSTPGPHPTVVLAHGGPWVRGGYWRWQAMPQFLASRGYLVLMPEFRGSEGYGTRHWKAGHRQWGLAMQDDLVDTLRWAQRQPQLAGAKACVAGGSYGGYATLMGLVRHGDQFRCGAAWAGVADLKLLLKGSLWVSDDASEASRSYGLKRLVGDIDKDPEALAAVDPLQQAARISAPLLLAHGDKDLRVPLEHAERLRDALTAAGRPPEWLLYRDEAHGFRKPSNQIDFAKRLERFLDTHLKQP